MTNETNQTDYLLDELLMEPVAKPQEQQTQQVKLMERLTEEEQSKAKQLATQIPVGDYESILTYGATAQNELTKFSHQMLDHVQKKDIGPVGDILGDLMKN